MPLHVEYRPEMSRRNLWQLAAASNKQLNYCLAPKRLCKVIRHHSCMCNRGRGSLEPGKGQVVESTTWFIIRHRKQQRSDSITGLLKASGGSLEMIIAIPSGL